MAAKIERGAFHLIEGAGHWPQWEKPGEFVDQHVSFLLTESAVPA